MVTTLILNVWDIGIRQDCLRYYYYAWGNDALPSIAHNLLDGNDVYGLLGMRQLLPDVSFDRILRDYIKTVSNDTSWNHIVDGLYHHDAMPHPDHFITIRKRSDDSYASVASYPFMFPTDSLPKKDVTYDRMETDKRDPPFLEKYSITGVVRLRPRRDKKGRGHGKSAKARRRKSREHDVSKRKRIRTV